MSKKKAVLVTGGAGFIGSHLAEKLLAQGRKVFVLDNLSTGWLKNIEHLLAPPAGGKNFTFTKGDVLDKNLVRDMVSQADEVYHLAAAVGVKVIMEKPLESWLVNIKGTENVLEAALERKTPVLIASTSEIYGKNTKLPFGEDDDRVYGSVRNYRWGYAFSKGVDEFLGLAYFREYGLPVRIVRFFNTVGPRQRGMYGMVLPTFVGQVMRGDDVTVYGSGKQTRCFGYVGDVVDAAIKIMEHPKSAGEVYNLGSDEEIAINDLAEKVLKIIRNLSGLRPGQPVMRLGPKREARSNIVRIPYKDVYPEGFEDMERRKPDLTKVRNLIGYKPTKSIDDIIKEIYESGERK